MVNICFNILKFETEYCKNGKSHALNADMPKSVSLGNNASDSPLLAKAGEFIFNALEFLLTTWKIIQNTFRL